MHIEISFQVLLWKCNSFVWKEGEIHYITLSAVNDYHLIDFGVHFLIQDLSWYIVGTYYDRICPNVCILQYKFLDI